jgi:hypothetical protein
MRLSKAVASSLFFLLLSGAAAAFGDSENPEKPVLVSGKTVYGNMGIEEVALTATRADGLIVRGRSGYHGSFLLHLPPGVYDIGAAGETAPGQLLQGRFKGFNVPPGPARIEKLVIQLER